jgi:hypothetical protein
LLDACRVHRTNVEQAGALLTPVLHRNARHARRQRCAKPSGDFALGVVCRHVATPVSLDNADTLGSARPQNLQPALAIPLMLAFSR